MGSLGISASGISVSRDPVNFGVFLWFSVIVRILQVIISMDIILPGLETPIDLPIIVIRSLPR